MSTYKQYLNSIKKTNNSNFQDIPKPTPRDTQVTDTKLVKKPKANCKSIAVVEVVDHVFFDAISEEE